MLDEIIEREKKRGPFTSPASEFNRLALRQSVLRYLVRDCGARKVDALLIAEDAIAGAEIAVLLVR